MDGSEIGPITDAKSADYVPGELSVTLWPLAHVTPYHRNPRKNEQAVDAVAKSIQDFGFRQPIVVDRDGVIVAGHTRWKAAQKLGLEYVPVHVADLPPEKARAYRLADNATAELSVWDYELLALEVGEAKGEGTAVESLGLSDELLAKLSEPTAAETGMDPDYVPELPQAVPITTVGTIWILGDHRLMCGDSSKLTDLDELLGGERIHLVNTDPPYNVNVEPRGSLQLRPKDRPIANDNVDPETYGILLQAWFGNLSRVLEPGRGFYIWGGYANLENYLPAMRTAELYFSQVLVWFKDHPVLSRKDFNGNFELCYYGWREGAAHEFFGGNANQDVWRLERTQVGSVPIGRGVRLHAADGTSIDVLPPDAKRTTRIVEVGEAVEIRGASETTDVWTVKKVPPQKMVHLTEKPVELAERAMRLSSRPGENVLDLFGGSGSTLIAAERMGRKAFLMEMDPLYCDVIVARWEKYTGRKADRLTPRGEA
jgi:DNA modification methylase